jgi:zinc transport system permease protein
LLGSFTILRQFTPFLAMPWAIPPCWASVLGCCWASDPSWVLLPFAVVFALVVTYFLERTQLWTDALLNIIYSSSLAVGIILLSFRDEYQGGITNILFGDILAVQTADLIFGTVLLAVCAGFIGLTLRSQILLTLHEPMAIARGLTSQPSAPLLLCCFLSWWAFPSKRSAFF